MKRDLLTLNRTFMTIDNVTVIALVLSLINFTAAIFGFARLYSLDVELNAIKKSTHKIQWMPADPEWAQSEKEVNQAFEQDVGHPSDLEGLQ